MSSDPGPLATDARRHVPVARVALHEFTVAAPIPAAHHAAVRPDVRTDPVRGWLVGVSDGESWGWWGPVAAAVARQVPDLLAAAFPDLPVEVELTDFARRVRRATRHAHTGILAVSIGSLELALWDLAAKRAALPVWGLLAPVAARDRVPSYATCFGVRAAPERLATVLDEVAGTYAVQKWDPLILGPGQVGAATGFADRHGPLRLAVDFHGRWHPDQVRKACEPLAGTLAWVEEPYHPDEVAQARAGEFGAAHAAGEHCYSPADAAHLRAGHVDIWQPDAVFCGGFINLMSLVRSAAQAGVGCIPHGGGLLPALHLATIGGPIDAVEVHLLLEPRRCAHLTEPPPLGGSGDGALPVPTAPGWGGEVRADLVDA